MRKFSIFIATAAAACVTGSLWADSVNGSTASSGGDRPNIKYSTVGSATGGAGSGRALHKQLKKGKPASGKHFSAHDKNQMAGQLKGKSSKSNSFIKWSKGASRKDNSFIKYSKANDNQKLSSDTWVKGGSAISGGSNNDTGFKKEGDLNAPPGKGLPLAHP